MYKKLCIPRIDVSHTKEQIANLFQEFELGTIEKINIVPNALDYGSGNKTKKAFIFIKDWTYSDKVNRILKRFENGQDIKLVYESPFYWKVVLAH